jgi:hypothetical protein
LKLAGRHAHEVPKHGCEVRLVFKPDSQRNVDNLCVTLAEKLLRTIDSLLQNELMRSEAGAELEQLGENPIRTIAPQREGANLLVQRACQCRAPEVTPSC